MLEGLQDRAERVGKQAVERARHRIVVATDAPGVSAVEAERGIVLSGRGLSERLRWIGGLFR